MRGQKVKWKKERTRNHSLPAGYTVEAAGVMAVVFFSIMVLVNQAFRIHAETTGTFGLHEAVERDRHAILHTDEDEITMETQGGAWEREITATVFRPEETLRAWSLTEEQE